MGIARLAPRLTGKPVAAHPVTPRVRVAVFALGVLAVALAVAAVPLDVVSRQGSPAEPLIAAASFTAVGLVVARRHPHNPMGWLLAAIGLLVLLTVTGGYYAVLEYRLGYRLPIGPLALVLDVLWEPALLLLPLVILLFPDGRLPSRRWRWTMEAYLALAGAYLTALVFVAVQSAGSTLPVDASGAVNAVDHPAGWLAIVQAIVIALYVPFWLAFVARQVQSWRHAGGERRQQLNHLPDGGVRHRDRAAGRGVRGPGAAGYPGAPVPQHGGGGGRDAGGGGAVSAGAAAGAAGGGPAVQPGPV